MHHAEAILTSSGSPTHATVSTLRQNFHSNLKGFNLLIINLLTYHNIYHMQRAKSLSLDLYLCTHMPSNIDIGFGHAIKSANSPLQAGGWWPDGENNTGRSQWAARHSHQQKLIETGNSVDNCLQL